MTWTLNVDTGELTDPSGTVRTTIEGPPFNVPDDVQTWAETEFRALSMADLDTGTIADFAQIWIGDVSIEEGSK